MILRDGIMLYHGSTEKVTMPDLQKCKDGKDFGRGFYLTTDKEQAEKFVKTSIRKKILRHEIPDGTKSGYVSAFLFHRNPKLNIFEFKKTDEMWLHCICSHRLKGFFPELLQKYKKYDIIAGKIANDRTNPTITLYLAGGFGEAGREEADKTAVRLLKPEILTDQACFRTEAALRSLEWKACEETAYE